jgi:hypothetical protein
MHSKEDRERVGNIVISHFGGVPKGKLNMYL